MHKNSSPLKMKYFTILQMLLELAIMKNSQLTHKILTKIKLSQMKFISQQEAI